MFLKIIAWAFAIGEFISAFMSAGILPGIVMIMSAIIFCPLCWGLLLRSNSAKSNGWKHLICGFAIMTSANAMNSHALDEQAIALGFANTSEYATAKALGLDSAGWAERKAKMKQAALAYQVKKPEPGKVEAVPTTLN